MVLINPQSLDEALRRLKDGADTQFDPRIVDHFLDLATKLLPELSTIEEFSTENPTLRVHMNPALSVQRDGF